MKKIYKFATGDIIPEGAIYLGTVTQTKEVGGKKFTDSLWEECWYVWHYFLIEVKDNNLE